jgi:hypothetical protein
VKIISNLVVEKLLGILFKYLILMLGQGGRLLTSGMVHIV